MHWLCSKSCRARTLPCRACTLPCRSAHTAVTQRCYLHPLVTIQKNVSRLNPCRSHSAVSQRCIATLLCYIATPKVGPLSRYKSCILTQNPCHARAPVVSQAVSHAWAPCSGVPLRAPVLPPRPCLSRYKTLYRDPTPKWAVAHSSFLHKLFFFSLIIFFSFVPATVRPQNFFFFHVFSRTKRNIFFFFFCSTHCKTSEKISSTHFFSYVLSTKHTSTQFNHTSQLIHQNAQWMHDLTRFLSSPRFSFT